MGFWKQISDILFGKEDGDYYPLTKPQSNEPLKEQEIKPVKKNTRLKPKRNTAPRKKKHKKKVKKS